MTVPADFLSQEPYPLVNPYEQFLVGEGSAPDTDPHDPGLDLKKIALVLAAAFVVYRVMMRAEMAKNPPPRSGEEARKLAYQAWKAVAPIWLRTTVPAITRAYQLGSTKNVSYQEMEKLASDYAASLGEYVNDTSVESLVEGFSDGLSSGWNENLAWIRASEGYGLDSRQMRVYVGAAKGDVAADPMGIAAKKMVDAGIATRAERLGENEAFAATQMGKVIVWMTMEIDGTLPQGTMKKWVTANDERVCPVCGPLDQDQVKIRDHFTTRDGQKYWAPGVHPNCRCQIELAYPEEIIKAMPGDPYDRKPNGEFSRKEERRPKLRLRERMADPVLDDLLRQAEQVVTPVDFSTPTPVSFGTSTSLFSPADPVSFTSPVGFAQATEMAQRFNLVADLYSSRFRGYRRVVHHILMDEPEPAGPTGDWGFYEEPVFFSGDDFTANWTNIPNLGQPKPAGDRPTFNEGSLLSVDALSTWKSGEGSPTLASIKAWGVEDDKYQGVDHPTASEAALLESLRAGLELSRVAASNNLARSNAAEAALDNDEDLSVPEVLGRQSPETLRHIVENAAYRGDGKISGSDEWQVLLANLPGDSAEQKDMLIDFILEGYWEGDTDVQNAINDEIDIDSGIPESQIRGLLMEAEATIDPYWTPTVVMAEGFYGAHGERNMRYVEGNYQVVETKRGYIPRERLEFLLSEHLTKEDRNALLETSPLMEKGEYKIVVVKPSGEPQYPVSYEEAEQRQNQADFNRTLRPQG